jgi:hypothetical protein
MDKKIRIEVMLDGILTYADGSAVPVFAAHETLSITDNWLDDATWQDALVSLCYQNNNLQRMKWSVPVGYKLSLRLATETGDEPWQEIERWGKAYPNTKNVTVTHLVARSFVEVIKLALAHGAKTYGGWEL